jgi:hypothetical protein
MMKRADISINVIIVAVLGLVVLIVLAAIFTGKIRIFGANVEGTCSEQQGACLSQDPGSTSCPLDKTLKWTYGCDCVPKGSPDCQDKKYGQCCIALLK